ncbi:MAG: hypothetical protein RML46_12515 [Anaerolineae bacterium]|nr:hypothetical protein [Anaerolineae bacterium]
MQSLADFLAAISQALGALVPSWQTIALGVIVVFAALRALRGLRVTGR